MSLIIKNNSKNIISKGSLLTVDNVVLGTVVMGVDMSDREDIIGVAVSDIREDGTINVLTVNSYSNGIGTTYPEFLLDINNNEIEEEQIEEIIKIRNNIQIAEDRLNAII